MLACFVQYRPKLLRVFPSLAFSERAENSHLLIKMRLGWMIQQNNLTSGGGRGLISRRTLFWHGWDKFLAWPSIDTLLT